MRDFVLFGGKIVIRKFDTPRDLMSLTEPVIVNCTGLGSRALFNDEELVPIKGQLTVLVPQPEVSYRASGQLANGNGQPVGMNTRTDGTSSATLRTAATGRSSPRKTCANGWSAPPSNSSRRCGPLPPAPGSRDCSRGRRSRAWRVSSDWNPSDSRCRRCSRSPPGRSSDNRSRGRSSNRPLPTSSGPGDTESRQRWAIQSISTSEFPGIPPAAASVVRTGGSGPKRPRNTSFIPA